MKEILVPEVEKRLSPIVKKNLDNVVKRRLQRDFDYCLVISGSTKSGGVGDGKSTLGSLACGYVAKKVGGKFTIDHEVFSDSDYKTLEPKLRPKDSIKFDEGEEVFFSRTGMSRHQRVRIQKLAQIRDQRHFIVICVPSILLLEKWLRGMGTETRVSCIWRIVKRGVFYSYSSKTGTLQKIKLDTKTNSLKYPSCDFIGFWKRIPKKTAWWKIYQKKKDFFKKHSGRNPKIDLMIQKEREKLRNTLTLRDIADIHKVSRQTSYRWYKELKIFKKVGIVKGLDGIIRIKMAEYRKGLRRLKKIKKI